MRRLIILLAVELHYRTTPNTWAVCNTAPAVGSVAYVTLDSVHVPPTNSACTTPGISARLQ